MKRDFLEHKTVKTNDKITRVMLTIGIKRVY